MCASPLGFPLALFPLIRWQARKVIVSAGCNLFGRHTYSPDSSPSAQNLHFPAVNLFPFRLCHFGNFGPRCVYAMCAIAEAETHTSLKCAQCASAHRKKRLEYN